MRGTIGGAVTALSVLLAAGPLFAHHSFQAVFDVSQPVMLTGTLIHVEWTVPHVSFSVEAKGERGQLESWVIEAGPPSFFRNRKVVRSDFEKAIGQPVTIQVLRARDGSRRGALLKITFTDGRVVTSSPGA